ncbi:MAG: cation-translocating P-type ATPase [Verrucomicrobium sp.]|nr:cation-translocating P-type ATPase [Verrucomicrobium sp.]
MDETRLRIEGMTCAGCARTVEEALRAVPGVARVVVDLGGQEARVGWAGEPGSSEALFHAVRRAGYRALPAKGKGETQWNGALRLGLPVTALLMFLEWGLGLDHRPWYGIFSFWITLPVLLWVGVPFYRGAARQLARGRMTMDTLVTVGSLAAWGLSVHGLLRPGHQFHLYFMEAAAIVSLIGIGHWLEGRISARANATLRRLFDLAPAWARRLRPSGEEEETAVSDLAPDDLILIKPGDRIPIDGVVFENHGQVDESLLTGEAAPVEKGPGSPVYAGTLSTHRLVVRVTGLGRETALARIVASVERALASRAAVEKLADQVSAVFVPVVVLLAALTFLYWVDVARLPWEPALVVAVSVVVVACPCALGLATPATLLAATNAAARRGILFRDARALEKAGRIDAVLFDKTGTLTEPEAVVEKVQLLTHRMGRDEAAALARALASSSTHPASRTVVAHFAYAAQIKLTEWKEETGAGVSAIYQGETARLGNPAWVQAHGVFVPPYAGLAPGDVALSLGHELLALIHFNPHRPRPEAAAVLRRLEAEGYAAYVVSGDTAVAAEKLAHDLGIAPERVFAPVRPEGKAEIVARLQKEGRRVAFVGDGLNDGPALAQADLGVAVLGASDLAREAADVVLLRRERELEALPEVLALSIATRRAIVQNLFWALAYNVVLIPLAMAGRVPPVAAAVAMSLSDLCVMGNAWRLSLWRARK